MSFEYLFMLSIFFSRSSIINSFLVNNFHKIMSFIQDCPAGVTSTRFTFLAIALPFTTVQTRTVYSLKKWNILESNKMDSWLWSTWLASNPLNLNFLLFPCLSFCSSISATFLRDFPDLEMTGKIPSSSSEPSKPLSISKQSSFHLFCAEKSSCRTHYLKTWIAESPDGGGGTSSTV